VPPPADRPRVVFLTDIVTPYMAAVMEALAARVELTALFCSQTGTRAADWAFEDGLRFRHRVLGGWAIRRRNTDATDLYPSPRILRALVEACPDAVISSGYSFPSAYAAAYGRLSGARLVLQSDGTSFSERNLSRAQLAARAVLLRVAAACVGNSEPAAQRFIELGARPERVFHALHTTNMAPFWEVAVRRAQAPAAVAGALRVVTVGRLIPRKGIDLLLRALAVARATEPGIHLAVVGSGPEEAALRRLTQELALVEAVEFLGFIDQPGLPAVYDAADVFAFPTRDDPFGIVLLEAAASGLPLVASPFGGATLDLVEDGRTGYVTVPDHTPALASALVSLARDPALRRRMGAAAHASTRPRTPAAAADGYAQAVACALGASGRAGAVRRRRRRGPRDYGSPGPASGAGPTAP
jgi:glycosyltransferase involved in cell wall biosynthesis